MYYHNSQDREEGCINWARLLPDHAMEILATKQVCLLEEGTNLLAYLGFSNYCLPLQFKAIDSTEKLQYDGEDIQFNIHIWDRYEVEHYIYFIRPANVELL